MLIIKTDQPNTLVVTVSQNSELTNPEYLFSFTHIFSKQRVTFIPIDISTHKVRYDEFYFIEGDGVGEIDFPYQGLYTYAIYEQPSGSGNLNPALATNVVENGEAQIFPSSAATMESQYDIWISGNEDNANIIFAPDEPNPPSSPTPTPSVTPTQTPTLTPTPTPTPSPTGIPVNPDDLNALWWIDFTDASTLTINGSNIDNAVDKINGVNFSVPGAGTGPLYDPIGYLSVSGTAQEYVNELGSFDPLYTQNYSGMTWFGYMYDDFVTQQGGTIIRALVGFPSGTLLEFRDTANIPNSWRATVTTGSGDLTVDIDITYSAWTAIAVRIWEESGNVYLEVWENGSIIGQNSTSGTIATPIFGTSMQLMFGGGVDLNTEQSFFDRKLTDSEMGQMFTYFNNKY
jgi:hypothetical protein